MGFLGSGFMSAIGRYSTKGANGYTGKRRSKITKEQYQELMDIKKADRKWYKDRQPLFRNIGLCVSLILVIFAFNWKSYNNQELIDLGTLEEEADEILDIPISEQPPPPPPKTHEVFTIKEVEDTEVLEEIEIALDVEVTEETKIEEVVFEEVEIEEEEVETIFTIVESHPEPVGGLEAWNKYLVENIQFPEAASRLNVSGKVFVQFVVEKDGSLTDVKVVKGIGAGCDEEALRVISKAPKWIPGKQRGVAVRVQKIIPIYFLLKES